MKQRDDLIGLRTLVDCGAVFCVGRMPKHLRAAITAGWANHSFYRAGNTFSHTITLKIDRAYAATVLQQYPIARAA